MASNIGVKISFVRCYFLEIFLRWLCQKCFTICNDKALSTYNKVHYFYGKTYMSM